MDWQNSKEGGRVPAALPMQRKGEAPKQEFDSPAVKTAVCLLEKNDTFHPITFQAF